MSIDCYDFVVSVVDEKSTVVFPFIRNENHNNYFTYYLPIGHYNIIFESKCGINVSSPVKEMIMGRGSDPDGDPGNFYENSPEFKSYNRVIQPIDFDEETGAIRFELTVYYNKKYHPQLSYYGSKPSDAYTHREIYIRFVDIDKFMLSKEQLLPKEYKHIDYMKIPNELVKKMELISVASRKNTYASWKM